MSNLCLQLENRTHYSRDLAVCVSHKSLSCWQKSMSKPYRWATASLGLHPAPLGGSFVWSSEQPYSQIPADKELKEISGWHDMIIHSRSFVNVSRERKKDCDGGCNSQHSSLQARIICAIDCKQPLVPSNCKSGKSNQWEMKIWLIHRFIALHNSFLGPLLKCCTKVKMWNAAFVNVAANTVNAYRVIRYTS